METIAAAYASKRVLVTGHTGFKGAWLTYWLHRLGAAVTGFSLDPNTVPALFDLIELSELCSDYRGDLQSYDAISDCIRQTEPDYVFHLAAQPLVRRSYREPILTLQTNVMGTAHVLEAVRQLGRPCNVIIVTTDKCYENRETLQPYREEEPMGGHDLYSSSKGMAELLVSSYRRSFFPVTQLRDHGIALASARAGNVIGGGDWSEARIVPDAIRALTKTQPIPIRNPDSIRPWQHVLEATSGYLQLGAALGTADEEARKQYCTGYNFGPHLNDTVAVHQVADWIVQQWGTGSWQVCGEPGPHEAQLLRLNIDKAKNDLKWSPRWSAQTAIKHTIAWYRAWHSQATTAQLRTLINNQIDAFLRDERQT